MYETWYLKIAVEKTSNVFSGCFWYLLITFRRNLNFKSIHNSLTVDTVIADGMIVYGRTELEHDRSLIPFMETTIKNRLWLTKEKLQFKWKEVPVFGHRCSSKGIPLGLVKFFNRYSISVLFSCTYLEWLSLKISVFKYELIN